MKYLFLWLQGMLQSWGASSRFDLRQTLQYPTKSGIYGMLLAASGDSGEQTELLARMAECPLEVISFESSNGILTDYHMVGNGYDDKDKWQVLNIPKKSDGGKAVGGGAKRTYREYLQDRTFAAILGLPDDLAEKFTVALQNPVYDIYLGRKCCVPETMVFQGCFEAKIEALEALKAKIREWNDDLTANRAKEQRWKDQYLRPQWSIQEDPDGKTPGAQLLNDVPVRFGQHKLYADRWVKIVPFPQEDWHDGTQS